MSKTKDSNSVYLQPAKALDEKIAYIEQVIGKSDDLVQRPFSFGRDHTISASLLYIDGLVDDRALQKMMAGAKHTEPSVDNPMEDIQLSLEEIGHTEKALTYTTILEKLLKGNAICLTEGSSIAIAIAIPQFSERTVAEPTTETVVRGPREGFVENMRVNTSLIRRRLSDENLWIESMTLGERSRTTISIAYVNGIVDKTLVEELYSRLKRIDTDGILEDGSLEELIQDSFYTPFPTVYTTERPDTAAAHLLEGKIAIIVDGTPMVMIVPALFVHFFHNTEDYTQRSDISTLIRILRFGCILIALLGPSLYIAVTTFHQELIPTGLLGNLAAQREGTPFPTFIETLLMELTFEILREAGIRMPQPVGQAVSIVGAIVIGQAAVQAGIVSAAVVIVVSITAIAGFVFPSYNIGIPIRILRFAFMGLSASFGLVGICVGFTALLLHLSSLKSFGIPYMQGFTPFVLKNQQDMIFRAPKWMMKERPTPGDSLDRVRNRNKRPSPEQ
ncbi:MULTISPECIES: spore germination protein [Bacillaceae]|uniref:Spore gernimation protein KA n=1 Tax=Alkalicoccobacillus plakortidis TaxID=444060 RepID=A0A9D5I0G1_9BACI|nr:MULTISPECIES: spore germination protein [Bacillaceae]KQL56605.1 spore gernimation protein KA [Alkalicoccobacillus plakortidis]